MVSPAGGGGLRGGARGRGGGGDSLEVKVRPGWRVEPADGRVQQVYNSY